MWIFTGAEKPDGLVDTSEWRDVDGLTTDSAGTTDSGRVFARAAVLDGVDQDLERILAGQQVNDLERVLDDAHGHELLAVVAAVHHERADETLHDRTQRLAEALDLVAASRVRNVLGRLAFDGYVILRQSSKNKPQLIMCAPHE